MKIIKTGQSARDALKKGIDLACDCIKITLGPSGRNAVLGRVDIPPYITNDGVSIARHIEAEDELENQGVWIIKEACSVASNKSGDGTTTTAVLVQSIATEVFEKLKDDGSIVGAKVDAMVLKNEIDTACEHIVSELIKKSRKITQDEVYNVALTAGEFPWLAEMVDDVFKVIGKDGYFDIQESKKSSYEIFKGIELPAGFHSEYYQNNGELCTIKNPHVLVSNNPIDAHANLVKMIAELATEDAKNEITDSGIVLVAPEFSRDLLNRLTTTMNKTKYPVVALKVQTFGVDDLLKDVCALTGAKLLDKNIYADYQKMTEDFKKENLGRAISSESSNSKTTITGDGDTSERIAKIRQMIEETSSIFDRDNLEKRLAFLSGGIAVVKIGGESDFEKMYNKLKADNAFASAQNALKAGVVKGGGLALKEAGKAVDNILSKAIQAPYNQIQVNSGSIIEIDDSVIDPLSVTISALRAACSLAGMLITTEVAVAFKNENKNKDQS